MTSLQCYKRQVIKLASSLEEVCVSGIRHEGISSSGPCRQRLVPRTKSLVAVTLRHHLPVVVWLPWQPKSRDTAVGGAEWCVILNIHGFHLASSSTAIVACGTNNASDEEGTRLGSSQVLSRSLGKEVGKAQFVMVCLTSGKDSVVCSLRGGVQGLITHELRSYNNFALCTTLRYCGNVIR